MTLCPDLCGGRPDDEGIEGPQHTSSPSDARWVGGMHPCQRTASIESDIRRRDIAQGVTVDEVIHVEVLRPSTPQDSVVVATPEDRVVRNQHAGSAAINTSSRGMGPAEGPAVPSHSQEDPACRELIAPWEAPEFAAQAMSSNAEKPSSRSRHGSKTDTGLLHRNRGSAKPSRFSWGSSDPGEAAQEQQPLPHVPGRAELPRLDIKSLSESDLPSSRDVQVPTLGKVQSDPGAGESDVFAAPGSLADRGSRYDHQDVVELEATPAVAQSSDASNQRKLGQRRPNSA